MGGRPVHSLIHVLTGECPAALQHCCNQVDRPLVLSVLDSPNVSATLPCGHLWGPATKNRRVSIQMSLNDSQEVGHISYFFLFLLLKFQMRRHAYYTLQGCDCQIVGLSQVRIPCNTLTGQRSGQYNYRIFVHRRRDLTQFGNIPTYTGTHTVCVAVANQRLS